MEAKPLSPLARSPVRPVKRVQPANRLNGQNRQTSVEEHHEKYMRLALQLARRALGDTAPNPVVGAVIINHGRIVGQGSHRQTGMPHAEVEALQQAGAQARGATLYVTLEPCNHTGLTPPCCDAVIDAGIRHVVIAMKDPNPITNGRGIARLRRAGIEVVTGVLEEDAKRLNAPFAKTITTRMPWVVAKIAMSLDGKIATITGESRWISSNASRRLAHQLRRQADAIVVGVNTVLRDDPLLTARDPDKPAQPGRPIKVIVDSRLRTPLSSRCLTKASSAPTIIATTPHAAARTRAQFKRRGIEVITLPPRHGRVPLTRLFRELVRRYQITSILIEGGGELIASALEEHLVDRLVWSVAPIIIGGRSSPSAVGGEGIRHLAQAMRLGQMTVQHLDGDLVIDATVIYPRR
jgi:diaminohydroxyphosphoribosylaminopyrimidine deaminase/5-amino-6-(5-phosphoribosylamino)uracil reductase